jgi:hypothetical protein
MDEGQEVTDANSRGREQPEGALQIVRKAQHALRRIVVAHDSSAVAILWGRRLTLARKVVSMGATP